MYEAVEGLFKRQLRIEKEAAETAIRVVVRVLYCGICAGLAMLLPFFNGQSFLSFAQIAMLIILF